MKAGVSIPSMCGLVLAGLACAATAAAQKPATAPAPRISAEKSASFPVREGGRLKLVTDMGSVRVITEPRASELVYRVRIEADSSQPDAQSLIEQFNVSAKPIPDGVQIIGTVPWKTFRGRVMVNYEVRLPRRFNLEISTNAGNIRVNDVDGQVTLLSAGGNLVAGNIGGPAKLETKGGHITVMDVAGSLYASTLGGHVTAGSVKGDAVMRSAGGHITATSVQGTAQMETGGGNISLERGGAGVVASTAGGRIDVGEASGAIRANTAGGGIRVVRLSGPTQLQTAGGSIYLTCIQNSVRATTLAGGITAWILPDVKLQGISQLESTHGDILVYVPRELAITIEANVEGGGEHRIDAPGLPVEVLSPGPPNAPNLRAKVTLNGGGELLRLRAMHGSIRLRYSGDFKSLYERIYKTQMEAFVKSREWEEKFFEYRSELPEKKEKKKDEEKDNDKDQDADSERREKIEPRSRIQEWGLRVEEKIAGRIPVNAEVQNRKLVREVRPEYPEQARRDHVDGIVWLEVMIDRDGKVEQINVISGHPLLAQAAVQAVQQWRYAPTYVGSKPVAVTTVVRLAFRLD